MFLERYSIVFGALGCHFCFKVLQLLYVRSECSGGRQKVVQLFWKAFLYLGRCCVLSVTILWRRYSDLVSVTIF